MHGLYLLSTWIHLLAAATWVGGMLFLVLAVVPVLRRDEIRPHAARLVHLTGVRFRAVGWACFALLAATGVLGLVLRAAGDPSASLEELLRGRFGILLAAKLGLVAAVIVLSALHDFGYGPRATEAWQRDPDGVEARSLRRTASWIGRVNLLLALAILALAVAIARL